MSIKFGKETERGVYAHYRIRRYTKRGMGEYIDKNLMVFESRPDFSDNSRGLWEFVVKNTSFRTFWVVKDENMAEYLKERGIECGVVQSELSNKMISTAQFLITSNFEFADQKRPGQIHVAAWHGFPLKVIGFFESAASDMESFKGLKVITTQSDIITATSRLSHLTLSGMFSVDPRKVKETGYPRNDIMFWSNAKKELHKITSIDIDNSKLIFYLPTMRKGLKKEGEQFEHNIFNYSDYDAEALNDFLEKNNAYIFAKVHFADNELFQRGDFRLSKRIIFIDTQTLNKHFLTIYHIMNAFDVLVTDYSSVYVDFLLLNKPIIFSCPDLERYQYDRGFVVDNPTLLMPGAIVKSQREFIQNLNEIFEGNDKFVKEREEKFSLFHNHKDGNSSKRLLEEMLRVSQEGVVDSGKDVVHLFADKNCSLFQCSRNNIQAEFFFDRGNGFSEEDKLINKYNIEEGEEISFYIDVPANIRNIRFDPDNTGRGILKALNIIGNDGEHLPFAIVNGKMIGDDIVFYEADPQIIITLDDREISKLQIKFKWGDMFVDGGRIVCELTEKKMELENELIEIHSSRSWKMTKVFRCVGKGIKYICKRLKK